MSTIGFVGLGHMGGHMAKNLLKHGHTVIGLDLSPSAVEAHIDAGGRAAVSLKELVTKADIIITMLPKGSHVAGVCRAKDGIFANAKSGTLIIDSSTIDVATSNTLAEEAKTHRLSFIDAPVSGGVVGAEAGTLSFMVGADKADYTRAKPLLQQMGKSIFHVGAKGTGLGVKIANNMLLGINMLGASEAFNLAQKLGVDAQTFYDIVSVSTGSCWAVNKNCPAPNVLPTAPASHNYEGGFGSSLMLKDLKLSQEAAQQNTVSTPLGAATTALYEVLDQCGLGHKDMSVIMQFLIGKIDR